MNTFVFIAIFVFGPFLASFITTKLLNYYWPAVPQERETPSERKRASSASSIVDSHSNFFSDRHAPAKEHMVSQPNPVLAREQARREAQIARMEHEANAVMFVPDNLSEYRSDTQG